MRKQAQKNLRRGIYDTNSLSSLILLENAGYTNLDKSSFNDKYKKLCTLDPFDANSLRLINKISMLGEAHGNLDYSSRRLIIDPFLFEPGMRYYRYLDYALRYPERGLLEFNLIKPETTRVICYINGEKVLRDIY